jgi:hypothetical protein
MGAPIVDQAAGVFADPKSNADEPRPLLATAQADDMARRQLDAGMGLRTLIHMDDPRGPREGRGLVPPEGDDGRP